MSRDTPASIVPPGSPGRPSEMVVTSHKVALADGVDIFLPVAGPILRGLAYLTDILLLAVFIFLCGFLLSLVGFSIGLNFLQLAGGFALLLFFVLNWLYHACMELTSWGGSFGKRWLGLRVVRINGATLTWRDTLMRNLLRPADLWPLWGFPSIGWGLVGVAATLSNKRFQRLGDLAADCMVIYEPARARAKQRRIMGQLETPPTSLPVPSTQMMAPPIRLTREERQAIQSFSLRLGHWSEKRQQELADMLEPLTAATGQTGVDRLIRIAAWLKNR